jgi:hypothetical protein
MAHPRSNDQVERANMEMKHGPKWVNEILCVLWGKEPHPVVQPRRPILLGLWGESMSSPRNLHGLTIGPS